MNATHTTTQAPANATCPFLKQVVMLYCDACPMKKMVPLDHLVSGGPCVASSYEDCPMYLDVVAKAGLALPIDEEPPPHATGSQKEVPS